MKIKLKEDNRSMNEMIKVMKDAHVEKLESNKSELENFKITVSDAEVFTVMLMKEEHKRINRMRQIPK